MFPVKRYYFLEGQKNEYSFLGDQNVIKRNILFLGIKILKRDIPLLGIKRRNFLECRIYSLSQCSDLSEDKKRICGYFKENLRSVEVVFVANFEIN